MTEKPQEIPPRDLYIYNVSPAILNEMTLMSFDSLTTQQAAPEVRSQEETSQVGCSSCKITWENATPSVKREHYKSDFHRLNCKRVFRGLGPIDEGEFDSMVETESISGSESEQDEPPLETIMESTSLNSSSSLETSTVSHLNTRTPFVNFKSTFLPDGKCLGAYKAIFSAKELNDDPLEALKRLNSGRKSGEISALFMIGGGHFAGAIISHTPKSGPIDQSVDVVVSKTFHRYTTRRKQGGSQSASDNANGKANSAGSSLRRYNEQALSMDVRELLKQWRGYLDKAHTIYIRANAAASRNIIVGWEKSPISVSDPRIRSFPFTTKRPTSSELKRAWINLAYLHVLDTPKVDESRKLKAEREKEALLKSQSDQKKKQEDVLSDEEKHTVEVVQLIKKSRAPGLVNYIRKKGLSVDMLLAPEGDFASTPTMLHLASSVGSAHMVHVLLTTLKADPTRINVAGKTAYEIAPSVCKNVFQTARFTLGESYCDWKAARVGEPKSKEQIASEEAAQKEEDEKAERKVHAEQLEKQKAQDLQNFESRFGREKRLPQMSQQVNLSSLSNDQRMRLMREQRARAAEARFKQ